MKKFIKILGLLTPFLLSTKSSAMFTKRSCSSFAQSTTSRFANDRSFTTHFHKNLSYACSKNTYKKQSLLTTLFDASFDTSKIKTAIQKIRQTPFVDTLQTLSETTPSASVLVSLSVANYLNHIGITNYNDLRSSIFISVTSRFNKLNL